MPFSFPSAHASGNELTLTRAQKQAVRFCYSKDSNLLWADVGTGKTIIVLRVLHALYANKVIEGAMIVAPLRVCQQVWPAEQKKWSAMLPTLPPIANAAGTTQAVRKRIVTSEPFFTINYENLQWLTENVDASHFSKFALVFDEIDKMKSPNTSRFKAMCNRISTRGFTSYADSFIWRCGMTGTPRPNHLSELWAQVHAVTRPNPLSNTYRSFVQRYFTEFAKMHTLVPKYNSENEILLKLKPFIFRIEARQGENKLPILKELEPRTISLRGKDNQEYNKVASDMLGRIDAPATTVKERIEAFNDCYTKLKHAAQGHAYEFDATGTQRTTVHIHKIKYSELDSLISELNGQQLLIVYHFQSQLEELQRRYGDRLGSFNKKIDHDIGIINKWNSGLLELLAMQPQAAGHGLNLQESHAHHICFLTLPESAGTYQQVIGRLLRKGNDAPFVYVHKILIQGTVDGKTKRELKGKISSQNVMLQALCET